MTCSACALELRSYVQLQHDWFFGNPGGPFLNTSFTPSSSLFRGIAQADHPTDWHRHFALISPQHFVHAAHYSLSAVEPGQLPIASLRFIGPGNILITQAIQSTATVKNALNQDTDLMLGTLSAPLSSSSGITPFAVLNLTNEAAYQGLTLQVFGKAARSSKMPLNGFTTLVNDPGFDTTRFAYFDYNAASGLPNDCNFEGGDSGSPVFILQSGQPALVGTNSGRDYFPSTHTYRNYLNFIPAYLPQLDALMEAQGYHVKRFYPAPTTVSAAINPGGTLRRLRPGNLTLAFQNTGSADAHNFSGQVTFSHAPSALSGTGWITEAVTPLVWRVRRGGITQANSSSLTASWSSLPGAASIQANLEYTYDGGSFAGVPANFSLLESYASWSLALPDPGVSGDSDHDGTVNLLEYAFGGDPQFPSLSSTFGKPLLPVITRSGNSMLIHYPRRTDAAARDLQYQPQVSSNLGAWSTILPNGTTTSVGPYTPAIPGFEEVTHQMPIQTGNQYVRIKVLLNEP